MAILANMAGKIHPEVAAALKDVRCLVSIMDDQQHKMDTATFTGTDEARSVHVTLNGHHQLIDVYIHDGLLQLGGRTVAQRLTEALRNASAAATAALAADQERIDGLIAEVTG